MDVPQHLDLIGKLWKWWKARKLKQEHWPVTGHITWAMMHRSCLRLDCFVRPGGVIAQEIIFGCAGRSRDEYIIMARRRREFPALASFKECTLTSTSKSGVNLG